MNMSMYRDDPRLQNCVLFAPEVFPESMLLHRDVDIVRVLPWSISTGIYDKKKTEADKPCYDLIVSLGNEKVDLLSVLYLQKNESFDLDSFLSQVCYMDDSTGNAQYLQYLVLSIDIEKHPELFKGALATVKTPLTRTIFRHLYGKG